MFRVTNRYRYQFVGEVVSNILSTKEITYYVTLGIPDGKKKVQYMFLLLLALKFDQKSKYNFLGTLNRKSFEITLHAD